MAAEEEVGTWPICKELNPMVLELKKLTPEQLARMPEWRDKWIKIGLSTERMDLPRFTRAVNDCYRLAQLGPPKVVIAVPSPIVVAFAGPIAAAIVEKLRKNLIGKRSGSVHRTVRVAVGAAVDVAVGGAVDHAVERAVDRAVGAAVRVAVVGAVDRAVVDAVRVAVVGAVDRAVDRAVVGAVVGAVGDAVDRTVRVAVGGAVGGAVRDAVDRAVGDAVDRAMAGRAVVGAVGPTWNSRFGGQFWVGGWWASPAFTSFCREVCGLQLPGDMDERAIAYQETTESACWWWPHRDYVIVSDRPQIIHRDQQGRLHNETGPAIAWADGFGVWSWHGTSVPRDLIEAPVDPRQIGKHKNAEHNRVSLERYGVQRFVTEFATILDASHPHGLLAEIELDGRRQKYIIGTNGTPNPDGSRTKYVLLADNRAKNYREACALSYPTLSGVSRTAKQYHLSGGRT